MNEQAKEIISKDLKKQIMDIVCPMESHKMFVEIEPFYDEKHLHESKIIYVTFTFLTKDGSTSMIQSHQLEEMESLGYKFVSVDSDGTTGMKITFHKSQKFTTI